jgi:ureidoglycolate hydrolase
MTATAAAMKTMPLTDLVAVPLTPEAFAPFGKVIMATDDMTPATDVDEALDLSEGAPRFYIMKLDFRGYEVKGITRHRAVTQCLASVGGRPWLLGVAPPSDNADPAAQPDLEAIRAFIIPGDVSVLLYRGTWHAGPYFHSDQMSFFNLELNNTNVVDHHTCHFGPSFGFHYRLIDSTKP